MSLLPSLSPSQPLAGLSLEFPRNSSALSIFQSSNVMQRLNETAPIIQNLFLDSISNLSKPFSRLSDPVFTTNNQISHLENAHSNTVSSCSLNMIIGAVMYLITNNLIVSGLVGSGCFKSASASREVLYQGELHLAPGESWYGEVNRKVAVCKRGVTAWDGGSSCNYGGPDPHITVVRNNHEVLFKGPLSGSYQWFGNLKVKIVNNGNERADLYLHSENGWADFGDL